MSVKFFHSGMNSAPVLSGSVGAMIGVLDACLKDGFGSKSVTSLTISGGVATMNVTGSHSAQVGTSVLVGGATPSGLNGDQKVTAITGTSVSFATTEADGTATGTITFKMSPLGFTTPFTGTNLRVYKSAALESTGMYLRIDDTGTSNARVRAYEAMADASTGTGPTPLEAQVAGGLYWPKSSSANATARAWYLVADERAFFLAVDPAGTGRFTVLFAGDIGSFKSGDAYGYLVTGNEADQANVSTVPNGCVGYSHRSARVGAYLVRSHTAIGQAIAAQRIGAHHNGSTADAYAGTSGYSWGTYPNGPNNGLLTGPLELVAQGIRGTLPGLLHPVQDLGTAFANGGNVDGTDDMAGRRLLAIRTAPPAGAVTAGTVFLDTTGPWSR